MSFEKGRKKTGGRQKGTKNRESVVSLNFTRDQFRDIQQTFAKVANQKPSTVKRKAASKNLSQYKNMWEFVAVGMMDKITDNNPALAETYLKFIFGNIKPTDIMGHESNSYLQKHIGILRQLADAGQLTIDRLVSWYSAGAEMFGNDTVALRTLNRVYSDTLAALTAKETIDMNKNNSVPIKTLNILLNKNSLTVQKVLANYPELLEKYAEQWTGDMQEVLLNVMAEEEALPVKKKAGNGA